nr:DUF3631 domain-containing protein [Chloroflexota bacterium]
DEHDVSVGIRLLAEIRDAFDDKATDHLSTHDLLAFLHELEEAPWGDWYGKPLTPRALARLLDPYGVRPLLRRPGIGAGPTRGYFRTEFTDAWSRYVPVVEPVTSVTSDTPSMDEHDPEPTLFRLSGDAVTDVTDVTDPQTQPRTVEGRPT